MTSQDVGAAQSRLKKHNTAAAFRVAVREFNSRIGRGRNPGLQRHPRPQRARPTNGSVAGYCISCVRQANDRLSTPSAISPPPPISFELAESSCGGYSCCSLPPCGGGLGRGVVADAVNGMQSKRATFDEMARSRSNRMAMGMLRVRSVPPSLSLPHKGGGNPQTTS